MTQSPPIESVDRAVRVLQALAEAGPSGISLVTLALKLDLNKATVHRMLAALKFRDFAAQDLATGHYVLGGGAAQLGASFYARENLAAILHPALLSLSAQVSELVHLGTSNGTNIVYLDKVEPDHAVRVFSAIGSSVPVISTAMGQVTRTWSVESWSNRGPSTRSKARWIWVNNP
ncbi:helix-turn-helix domain-containing protein [Jonesiaceae bacterium BS-20]|uniref:Helix-turn-helix domain-containing protein n=1 Tax=Jonesiaceae bacterium BS-20 TaxID=3120821 RepID=A0AAU7E0C6_9MICO